MHILKVESYVLNFVYLFRLPRVFIVTHGLHCPSVHGILVPQPGLEPTSPALQGRFLTTGPPGKFLRVTFYLSEIFTTSSPGASPQIILRELFWGGKGGSQDIQEFCNKGHIVWSSKILLIKTRYLEESSAFLCKGRCKSLGSQKLFLWHTPQLSGTSILYFHILSVLRVYHGEWLQSDGY